MPLENVQPAELHEALKSNSSELEARKITDKYEQLMSNLEEGAEAKKRLAALADDIVSSIDMDWVSGSEDLKLKIESLNQELDSIGASLLPEIIEDLVVPPEVLKSFGQVESLLKGFGIDLNVDAYMDSYLAMPEGIFRVDLDKLVADLSAVCLVPVDKFHVKAQEVAIIKAVGLYLSGNVEQARNLFAKSSKHFETIYRAERLIKQAGLPFDTGTASLLISSLEESGISFAQLREAVEMLKVEFSGDFANYSHDSEALAALIFSCAESYASGPEGPEVMARKLEIERRITKSDEKFRKEIQEYIGKLEKYQGKLSQLQWNKPDDPMTKDIASCQRHIAMFSSALTARQRGFAVNQIRRKMAYEYLDKPGVKPGAEDTKAAIDDILKYRRASGSIAEVADKYNLDISAEIGSLQAMEAKVAVSKLDHDVAEWMNMKTRVEDGVELRSPRAIYNEFLKTGYLSENGKAVVHHQLQTESQALAKVADKMTDQISDSHEYLGWVLGKYKNISQVPDSDKSTVIAKLTSYQRLANQYRKVNGRLIGIYGSYEAMIGDVKPQFASSDTNSKAFEFDSQWGSEVKKLQDEDGDVVANLENVSRFLGEDVATTDISVLSASPLHRPILRKAVTPFQKRNQVTLERATYVALPIQTQQARFQYLAADPERAKLRSGMTQFSLVEDCTNEFSNCVRGIAECRRDMEECKKDINNAKAQIEAGTYPLLEKHPALKPQLLAMMNEQIAIIDLLLTSEASPISRKVIEAARLGISKMNELKDKLVTETFKNIAKFAFIVVSILGTAVMGGVGLAMLGSKFGVIAGAGRGVGAIASALGGGARVTAAASWVGQTAAGSALVSAGGVVGMEVGKSLNNSLGFTQFDNLWDWDGEMYQNFKSGFAVSFGFVSAAKLIHLGATSVLPLVSKPSQGMVNFLDKLSAVSSPAKWFAKPGQAAAALEKGFFGKVAVEFLQETAEMAAETIPGLGQLFVLANSADGMNVDLSMAGINAHKSGISIEGDQLVYLDTDPEMFAARLVAGNLSQDSELSYDIKPNGVVDVVITGRSVETSRVLTFAPANATTVFMTEVESIDGITKVGEQSFEMNDAVKALAVVNDFKNQGFQLLPGENGFTAVKGRLSVEVKTSPKVAAEIAAEINLLLKAYQSLMNVVSEIESFIKKGAEIPSVLAQKFRGTLANLSVLLSGGLLSGCNPFEKGAELGLDAITAIIDPFLPIVILGYAAYKSKPWKAIGKIVDQLAEFKLPGRVEALLDRMGSHGEEWDADASPEAQVTNDASKAKLKDLGDQLRQLEFGVLNDTELMDALKLHGIDRKSAKSIISDIIAAGKELISVAESGAGPESAAFKTAADKFVAQYKRLSDNAKSSKLMEHVKPYLVGLGFWLFYQILKGTAYVVVGATEGGGSDGDKPKKKIPKPSGSSGGGGRKTPPRQPKNPTTPTPPEAPTTPTAPTTPKAPEVPKVQEPQQIMPPVNLED